MNQTKSILITDKVHPFLIDELKNDGHVYFSIQVNDVVSGMEISEFLLNMVYLIYVIFLLNYIYFFSHCYIYSIGKKLP